jgi:hypothetical protein
VLGGVAMPLSGAGAAVLPEGCTMWLAALPEAPGAAQQCSRSSIGGIRTHPPGRCTLPPYAASMMLAHAGSNRRVRASNSNEVSSHSTAHH